MNSAFNDFNISKTFYLAEPIIPCLEIGTEQLAWSRITETSVLRFLRTQIQVFAEVVIQAWLHAGWRALAHDEWWKVWTRHLWDTNDCWHYFYNLKAFSRKLVSFSTSGKRVLRNSRAEADVLFPKRHVCGEWGFWCANFRDLAWSLPPVTCSFTSMFAFDCNIFRESLKLNKSKHGKIELTHTWN